MNEGGYVDEKLIEKAYYDVANGAAYFGPRKIHEFLKKKNINRVPSVYKIRKWLNRIDNYTLQKPVRRKIMRAKVLVSEPYEQFDADIADFLSISAQHDNYRYLLVVIYIFTRFLWVEKLKTKTEKGVLNAFKIVDSYNATPHRSLNCTAPKDVNQTNKIDLWAYKYLKPQKKNSSLMENLNISNILNVVLVIWFE